MPDGSEPHTLDAASDASRAAPQAGAAESVAAADGFDWLLHIDMDECVLPQRMHVCDVLALLPPECEQLELTNLEAVPPSEEVGDWFAEATDFKVNPSIAHEKERCQALWRAHVAEREADTAELTATATGGHAPPAGASSLFNAYVGGKSAIRVPPSGSGGGELPKCFGVHHFLVPGPSTPHGGGKWRHPKRMSEATSHPSMVLA